MRLAFQSCKNKMYLESKDIYSCCGCSACSQICPVSCISMIRDEKGFQYPSKDLGRCIDCGLCEKACPLAQQSHANYRKPSCYYGWHKDNEIRSKSSSGAAFIGITQVCIDQGIRYFSGVVYDEKLHVSHICTDDIHALQKMQTSKYVQSNTEGVFDEIKNLANSGERILFSGTPCQVDALQLFLGARLRDRVVTVALVCHGVASPLLFEKYIQETEAAKNSKVKSVRFRDKRIYKGKLNHRFTTVEFINGEIDSSVDNPYTIAFGLGYMHRPSCSRCKYATPLRNADITIGDFWGIDTIKPELKEEIPKGLSLILAHTPTGEEIAESLSKYMVIEQMPDYSVCANKQQQLMKPFDENPNRDNFIKQALNTPKGFIRATNKILLIRKLEKYKRYAVSILKKGKKK